MDQELIKTIVGNASTGLTLCVLGYFGLQGFTLWIRFQRDKWEDERHDRLSEQERQNAAALRGATPPGYPPVAPQQHFPPAQPPRPVPVNTQRGG